MSSVNAFFSVPRKETVWGLLLSNRRWQEDQMICQKQSARFASQSETLTLQLTPHTADTQCNWILLSSHKMRAEVFNGDFNHIRHPLRITNCACDLELLEPNRYLQTNHHYVTSPRCGKDALHDQLTAGCSSARLLLLFQGFGTDQNWAALVNRALALSHANTVSSPANAHWVADSGGVCVFFHWQLADGANSARFRKRWLRC